MISAKLAAARVRVQEKQPYLSAALWRLSIREIPEAEWPAELRGRAEICTDERGRVFACSALVQRARTDELAAALAHEVSHVLMDHFGRRGGRDPEPWNWAGDAAINPDVLDVWGALPYPVSAIIMPERIKAGAPRGLTSEQYYDMIERVPSTAGPCCGSAAGNPHAAQGLGAGDPDEQEVPDAVEWEAARKAVASQVREARRTGGRGSVPAGLAAWAEEALAPSPVDWRRALAGAVRSELRIAGAWDFTYARPSRRGQGSGAVLPAMRAPRLRAAVVVDTSGSRSDDDLRADLADVRGILRSTGCQEVLVISCDSAVHAKGRAGTAAQAGRLLAGRGGTDMRVGIAEAERSRGPQGGGLDVIIVLTDSETPWPDARPRIRTVVVVPEGSPASPAWARRVEKPRA